MQKWYELLARSSAGVESNKPLCQLEFMQVSLKKKKKAFTVLLPDDPFSSLTPPCLSFSPFRKKALVGRPSPFLPCIFASPLPDLAACLPPYNYRELLCRNGEGRAGRKIPSFICAFQSRLASSFCRWRDSSRASSLEATSGRASKEQPMLSNQS